MSEDRIIDPPKGDAPVGDAPVGDASGEDAPDTSDGVRPASQPGRRKPYTLRDALRKARQQEADRSDVIVDLREAELARLELLQDALSDVYDEIDAETDLLECALTPTTPPRLWIDVLAHVAMGRDKRTYRFVKDTRYGRQVILESTSLEETTARVTDYVAHRLLERERALDSDGDRSEPVSPEAPPDGPTQASRSADAPAAARRGGSFLRAVSIFLLGAIIGAAALFAAGVIATTP